MNKKQSFLLMGVAASAVAVAGLCVLKVNDGLFALPTRATSKSFTYDASIGNQFSGTTDFNETVDVVTGVSSPIHTTVTHYEEDCSLIYGIAHSFLRVSPTESGHFMLDFGAGINNLTSLGVSVGLDNSEGYGDCWVHVWIWNENDEVIGQAEQHLTPGDESQIEWTNETGKNAKSFDFSVESEGYNNVFVRSVHLEWSC